MAGKKKRGDRYDATRVPMPRNLNALFPYLMKGRNNSIVYYPLNVDVENLLSYIEQHKGTDNEVTIFQAAMLALVKVLRTRPTLNRYIIGRHLYQRHDVTLSFIARKKFSDDSEETNVLVRVKPEDDRATIISKLKQETSVAKQEDFQKDDDKLIAMFLLLPRSLLRLAIRALEWYDFYFDTPGFLRGLDPLRSSAYVANLGSVGTGAPYHHLFEWGTCSIFMSIGKIVPTVVVGDDGQPVVHRTMQLRFTMDERIADGYYDARSLELMEDYLRDPAQLEEV